MKRRLISIFVSLIIVLGAVYPALSVASFAAWNGGVSIPTLSGDVYQIATPENLAWFAEAVNSGTTAINAKLTADIQLNAEGSTANVWTPIGTAENPFEGVFDGDGFTVSGLYINSPDVSNVGLFGVINDTASDETVSVTPEYIVQTKVKRVINLNVTGASVTGYQNVGGIVGNSNGAGVEKCYFEGTVTGNFNSVGGIMGWGGAESVVYECRTSGTVVGKQRTGGLVGYCSANTVVSKSYSDASVTGTTNVGGLVGTLAGSNLVGSFFLGSVNADNRVGGAVGYSTFSLVRGIYTIATINSAGANKGGAVGVTYGGEYVSIFYCYENAGCDDPVGIARTLEEMQISDFPKELNKTMTYFCYDYTNINGGYPVLIWMLETDVWSGDMKIPEMNAWDTYLIYEPAELAWFAALVNGTVPGVEANPAANATVMADLLFNINVYDDTMGITNWTPIGTTKNPYTGTFNGNGYNLAGIHTEATAGEEGKNVGLFGYVGTAQIQNVLVMDGLICGKENVGGIAGYVMNGTLKNCVCDSEVRGDKAVGGVAGNIGGSTTVTSCGMIGSIKGTNESNDQAFLQNVGGVVGYNNRATVTTSFSYADISAPLARYVGGLIGNNVGGTLTNSYSTSNVIGNITCGGIVGYNNGGTVNKCYTAGKVTGQSASGIAFGMTAGTNVSECYYDASYLTLSNTITGATGKAQTEMIGPDALTNLGLSVYDWVATANDEYFYYYPQLRLMYNSNVRQIHLTSIESVRRVQDRYVARVEIDGRIDTYYETLAAAVDYAAVTASTMLPTVYIVRDVELSETINVSATIGLFGENSATLKRAAGFTGTMLNVTGALTIGSSVYGDDNAPSFYLSGNDVLATASGITVAADATLTVDAGVEIKDFKTVTADIAAVRGSVISSLGTVNVKAGIFNTNISKTVGGAIYNDGGIVNVSGGTFKNGEATQGAAIYNNAGTVTVMGGTFNNNIASLYGGAIATNALAGKTVISGDAVFNANQSTNGGALSLSSFSTVEINGGTFTGNVAYAAGGAVYVEDGSELVISAGIISNNVSNQTRGGAVYNAGYFDMLGDAQIDSSNDVYVVKNATVTVKERLDCNGYAATITPEVYSEGLKVLDGKALGNSFSKFGLTNTSWNILANGKMTSLAMQTVAEVSKEGAYSVQFTSLYDAFESIADDETAIITVIADNTVTKPITVRGDVTLTCDETTFVTMRGGSFYGIMFDVVSCAKLRLGDSVENVDQQAQKDYAAGTRTEGQMILDGGYGHTSVVGAAAVNVQSGGELYFYDDAIIQNFKNTTTGTVTVSGTANIYGGTICNNQACYGGAVYVKQTGTLNTYGGVICDNTSENGGNAIYSLGRVNRNVYSYDYHYIEYVYDDEGNFVEAKDPVYYSTVSTDIMVKQGDTVYLNNNMIYLGTASSVVHITNLTDIPTEDPLQRSVMTLDFAKYTIGAAVLSGTGVSSSYSAFEPYEFGYYIDNGGKLGINKIIPKETSGLKLDREQGFIYGFDLDAITVGDYINQFENTSTYLRFYDMNGKVIRNTGKLTTCCYIQLRNTSGQVIDTVTVVVYGDVNCDYIIDGQDSVLIKAMAGSMLTADNTAAAVLEAADVNFDGRITDIDAQHTDASGLMTYTVGQG